MEKREDNKLVVGQKKKTIVVNLGGYDKVTQKESSHSPHWIPAMVEKRKGRERRTKSINGARL